MTVHFDHLTHIATVWVPELSPTRGTAISTLVAILVSALFIGAIAAMFAGVCLERKNPVRFGAISALVLVGLIAALPVTRQRIFDAAPINGASSYPERQDALNAAQEAAVPASAWKVVAHPTKAPASTSKATWASADLQALSKAVESKAHVNAMYPNSEATVDTTNMTSTEIATSGTSYLAAGQKHVRCVAELSDVKLNNVGQPLSATLQTVTCEPVATTATAS